MRRGFGFLQLEMKGNLSFATLHSVYAHSLRILEEFRPEKPDGFEFRLYENVKMCLLPPVVHLPVMSEGEKNWVCKY